MSQELNSLVSLNEVFVEKINHLINGDLIEFIKPSEAYDLALNISYFISCKEAIIDKVESVSNNGKILEANTTSEQIDSLFKDDNQPTIYEPQGLSNMEILVRIRNSLAHSLFDIDYEKKIIIINNIDSKSNDTILNCSIPFSWFQDFINKRLYIQTFANNFKFNLLTVMNREPNSINDFLKMTLNIELEMNSNDKFPKLEAKKIIYRILTTCIKANIPFEHDVNEIKSILDMENYFNYSDFPLSASDFLVDEIEVYDLYNNLKNEGVIAEEVCLYFPIISAIYIAKKVLKNKNIDLSVSKIDQLKIKQFSSSEIIPWSTYMDFINNYSLSKDENNQSVTIAILQELSNTSRKLFLSKAYSENQSYFDKILISKKTDNTDEFLNFYSSINETPDFHTTLLRTSYLLETFHLKQEQLLENLLYVYVQNIFAMNKEKFERKEIQINNPNKFKVYSMKKMESIDAYSINKSIIEKNEKELQSLTENLQKQKTILSKIPLDKVVAQNTIKENIKKIEKSIIEKQNELLESKRILDEFLKENEDIIIELDNKKFIEEYDSQEILRIIRNCFSHPGRASYDLETKELVLTDHNAKGNITAYCHIGVQELIEFLTDYLKNDNYMISNDSKVK